MKPRVTVAITTYNHEKFLSQCLDGIVKQKTNFPFVAFVSDDLSTDGTRKIIKKYSKKYPNIIKPIYQKSNLGPMDNFIFTLNEIHSEYVALCDGDDFWTDENKLQKQVDFLDENKDYNIVFHKTDVFYENHDGKESCVPVLNKTELDFDDLVKECFIPANTVMYRWKFSRKDSFLKKFPKNIVPGDYFVHLFHAYNSKIKFIPEIMSKYRKHDGGMWWLATEPGKEEQFHLKYGYMYLNFFKNVEKEFKLSNEAFKPQRQWLIDQTAYAYLKNNMYNEMLKLKNENEEEIGNCVDYIMNNQYKNYSKLRRILYMLAVNPRMFLDRVKIKIKRHYIKIILLFIILLIMFLIIML